MQQPINPTMVQPATGDQAVLVPGSRVAGKYDIVAEVGRGGMGVVYLARHVALGRDVALKALAPQWVRDTNAVGRLRAEALTQARLRHACIVTVHDFVEEAGGVYLAMDYVAGGGLPAWARRLGGPPLASEEVVRILDQILAGLAHAHAEGIVHRDLKPANLLVDHDGSVRIADFGIAVALPQLAAQTVVAGQRAAGIEHAGVAGTAGYMAPEVRAGVPADARADLYAVGVIAYWLLTGNEPGPMAPPVSRVQPGMGQRWDRWIARSLADEPAKRFSSAGEMLSALRELAGSKAPTVRRQDLTSAPTYSEDGGFRKWQLAGIALTLLVVGVLLFRWITRS